MVIEKTDFDNIPVKLARPFPLSLTLSHEGRGDFRKGETEEESY